MNWIVTIPKTVSWSDYERELATVADGSQVMNYRLPRRPVSMKAGDRCYVTHTGVVKGWMEIVGVEEKPFFVCSTTGVTWEAGWYMVRSGKFNRVEPLPFPGFQGYREFKFASLLAG